MNEIYLVRHGETEWNVAGRFQGKLDSQLSNAGMLQADAIATKLAERNFRADAFVASPRGRTRHTASIIASIVNLPNTQFDERLAEVSLGSWDGLTHGDIHGRSPGSLDGSTPLDWFFRSPDGESYDAAVSRARNWLDSTAGRTLAVSHALIGRIIRGAYLGLCRSETLSLPAPQDVIWRLSSGQIECIASN